MDLGKEIVVGVALDVTLFGTPGCRTFDHAARALKTISTDLNGSIYVAHPKNQEIPTRGGLVAALANYEECRIDQAIRLALEKVSECDADEKIILVITSRYDAQFKRSFLLAERLNTRKSLGCQVHFIGVGDKYDRESFSSLCGSCTIHHLDHPSLLHGKISEIVGIHGRPQDIQGPASGQNSIPDGSV